MLARARASSRRRSTAAWQRSAEEPGAPRALVARRWELGARRRQDGARRQRGARRWRESRRRIRPRARRASSGSRSARLCEASGDVARAAECLRARAAHRAAGRSSAWRRSNASASAATREALARALALFVDNADPDAAPERYTEALYRLGTLELYQGRPEDGVQHIDVALTRDGDYAPRARAAALFAGLEPADARRWSSCFERVARDAGDDAALLASLTHAARLGIANLASLHEAVELRARPRATTQRVHSLLVATVTLASDMGQINDAIWAVSALADRHEHAGRAQAAVDLLQESIAHAGIAGGVRAALAARGSRGEPARRSRPGSVGLRAPARRRSRRPRVSGARSSTCIGAPTTCEKLEACISSIEKAVDDPAQRHSLRIERMRILIAAGRKAEAETALRAVLEDDPDSDEACSLLEELLESQGRLSELHGVIERRLEAARQRGDRSQHHHRHPAARQDLGGDEPRSGARCVSHLARARQRQPRAARSLARAV